MAIDHDKIFDRLSVEIRQHMRSAFDDGSVALPPTPPPPAVHPDDQNRSVLSPATEIFYLLMSVNAGISYYCHSLSPSLFLTLSLSPLFLTLSLPQPTDVYRNLWFLIQIGEVQACA
jgi:hypothetical protein